MTYSTLDNLTNIIPESQLINLTNDEGGAKEINLSQLSSAIEYSDRFIDAHLRNKYTLPLKFVPPIITQLSCDITAYRLYSRRPSKVPEHIKDNYEEAKKILLQIQKEQIVLDLPSEHPDKELTKPAPMILTSCSEKSRKFSDELMKGFSL